MLICINLSIPYTKVGLKEVQFRQAIPELKYWMHSKYVLCLTYVRPPRPIVVKKLIANLVFLGLSLGSIPSKNPCSVLKKKKVIDINLCWQESYSYSIPTKLGPCHRGIPFVIK